MLSGEIVPVPVPGRVGAVPKCLLGLPLGFLDRDPMFGVFTLVLVGSWSSPASARRFLVLTMAVLVYLLRFGRNSLQSLYAVDD